jgi:acyl-CoA thioesterase
VGTPPSVGRTGAVPEWDTDVVFGGWPIAQAVDAAIEAAGPDVRLHSFHGYFLRPTRPAAPLEMEVEPIRDGRSSATRRVTSTQHGAEVLVGMCSYHVAEEGDDDALQPPLDLPSPEEPPVEEGTDAFDVVHLGATDQREDGTYESTRRSWYRFRGQLDDDPDTHQVLGAQPRPGARVVLRPSRVPLHVDGPGDAAPADGRTSLTRLPGRR